VGPEEEFHTFLTLTLDGVFFTQRKELQHTMYGLLGRSQSWTGCFGEENNLLPQPGIEPWFFIAQSLYQWSYPGCYIQPVKSMTTWILWNKKKSIYTVVY